MSIQAERLICDFCRDDEPTWRFTSDEDDRIACASCCRTIMADDRNSLAIKILATDHGRDMARRLGIEAALAQIIANANEFFDQPNHTKKLANQK